MLEEFHRQKEVEPGENTSDRISVNLFGDPGFAIYVLPQLAAHIVRTMHLQIYVYVCRSRGMFVQSGALNLPRLLTTMTGSCVLNGNVRASWSSNH